MGDTNRYDYIVEEPCHMKYIEMQLHLARLWIYDITIHMKLNVCV